MKKHIMLMLGTSFIVIVLLLQHPAWSRFRDPYQEKTNEHFEHMVKSMDQHTNLMEAMRDFIKQSNRLLLRSIENNKETVPALENVLKKTLDAHHQSLTIQLESLQQKQDRTNQLLAAILEIMIKREQREFEILKQRVTE